MNNFDYFVKDLAKLKQIYDVTGDTDSLKSSLEDIANNYRDYFGVGDIFLKLGESYFSAEDNDAGFIFVCLANKYFRDIQNKTVLYMRMAQYHFENGEPDAGEEYLTMLCTKSADNYEESIEMNGLSDLWEKYRHIVDGKVPPPLVLNDLYTPLSPDKCTLQISDITSFPKDELLSAISEHLSEMCAYGECMSHLNKWEKTVYYADTLLTGVGGEGFDGYLYNSGTVFEKAYLAASELGAEGVVSVMDKVRAKFPRKNIPKTPTAIENALEKLNRRGIDFEEEDAEFYDRCESELIECLYAYIKANLNRFR